MSKSNKPILEISGIKKEYRQGREKLQILKGIDLKIKPGEIVALVGTSGSGKSTLLHIAGLLDRPSAGKVFIDGVDAWKLSETKRAKQLRENIGFVYQFHHLLPEFTALENVMMPLIIQGISRKEAEERANTLLNSVGMSERASHRPSRLSGGEQQRVAILRALSNSPKVLFADEPTGNLDVDTSAMVFKQLTALVRNNNIGALIATHDLDLANKMDRIAYLDHGVIR